MVWHKCIMIGVIIIQVNLNQIKKMEEEYLDGLENNQMFIKVNLNKVDDMEKELFGGRMEQNMLENSNKEIKLALGHYIELEIQFNIKETG